MGRVAPLAVALAAATWGVAWAGPTHRIRVETSPPGAHVYLEDTADGPKCDATPCEFDAPVGDTTLIIQLENYGPVFDAITVKRSRDRKPQVFQYKLAPAVATIIVDDKRATGASILIEGKDKGKVPARIEVEAGAYQIVVKLGTKVLFKDFVDVASGDEHVIDIDANALAAKEPAGDKPGGDGGGSDDGGAGDSGDHGDHKSGGGGDGDDGAGGSITKGSEPSAPRERFVSAALVVDVGWRRFHYENAPSDVAPNEGEDGQVLAGPAVELWPAEMLGWDHLHGLSLFGRAEFGVNALTVEQRDPSSGADVPVGKTSWSSYEGSLRQRWSFDGFAAEASAGYVRDVFDYDDTTRMLPAADYQALRAGARAFLVEGGVAPYIAGEARIVFSGGGLGMPTQASATGIRGAAGIEIVEGPIYARAEGQYLHYEWTYPSDVNVGMPTGASDKIFGFSISAGYQY